LYDGVYILTATCDNGWVFSETSGGNGDEQDGIFYLLAPDGTDFRGTCTEESSGYGSWVTPSTAGTGTIEYSGPATIGGKSITLQSPSTGSESWGLVTPASEEPLVEQVFRFSGVLLGRRRECPATAINQNSGSSTVSLLRFFSFLSLLQY
jgi:hypothetical protein